MNISGVFWIVVSPKPDKRQKEKSLLCHLCWFTHSVSSQLSLSLSLNIVSDLERDIFSEGSTSEVLRPVYVPTFHLHTVYLGKLRKECLPFSPSSVLFIYLFFARDFNLRYYSTLSVTCPGFHVGGDHDLFLFIQGVSSWCWGRRTRLMWAIWSLTVLFGQRNCGVQLHEIINST